MQLAPALSIPHVVVPTPNTKLTCRLKFSTVAASQSPVVPSVHSQPAAPQTILFSPDSPQLFFAAAVSTVHVHAIKLLTWVFNAYSWVKCIFIISRYAMYASIYFSAYIATDSQLQ